MQLIFSDLFLFFFSLPALRTWEVDRKSLSPNRGEEKKREKGPRVGRSRCYRFDPDAGWRGSKKTLKAELRAIKGGRDDPAPETPAQPNLFPE